MIHIAFMLDKQGILLALTMGAVVFLTGGFSYLGLVLIFFVLAVLVTKHQHFRKKELGIYEHERSWENVLSNGIVPTIMAIASPWLGPLPFICSISAITSDKFASELGVLSGTPISRENLKPTKPGTSGAVSAFGLLMSLAGAILIGVSATWLFRINPNTAAMIGIVGFFGSVVNSIFSIFEERA